MDSPGSDSAIESIDGCSYYTDDDESLTSSIFGWYCDICEGRAESMTTLETEFMGNEFCVYRDTNGIEWVKCDDCHNNYHLGCWNRDHSIVKIPFNCCLNSK